MFQGEVTGQGDFSMSARGSSSKRPEIRGPAKTHPYKPCHLRPAHRDRKTECLSSLSFTQQAASESCFCLSLHKGVGKEMIMWTAQLLPVQPTIVFRSDYGDNGTSEACEEVTTSQDKATFAVSSIFMETCGWAHCVVS
jgi:hypothetical protein